MRTRRQHRPARAFTLIEVLAALVIFSVAIAGFIRAMGESARIQGDLQTQQRALMLAQNVMEEMRFSGEFEEGTKDGVFSGEDAAYRWRSDIEPALDLDGLLDVTVTISWNDGRERDLTLSTQMLKPETE